jgi:hypothetical protein
VGTGRVIPGNSFISRDNTRDKENQMAVTDTLFVELGGENNCLIPEVEPVALELRCPECGESLRLGTLDLATTGGYSIPFVFCKNNCDLRGYAF